MSPTLFLSFHLKIPLREYLKFSRRRACQCDNYLKNLLEIIETHPSESASQFGKSIIYYILDDYDKMLDYFEPLSESFPNLSLLHRRIAEAYIHQNKFSKAVNHLEKAVEINDKDLTAKVWLILLYFKVGKSKQADINFQELTEFIFVLDVSIKDLITWKCLKTSRINTTT